MSETPGRAARAAGAASGRPAAQRAGGEASRRSSGPRPHPACRRARRGWHRPRARRLADRRRSRCCRCSALWAGYSRVMASERLKVGRVDVRGSRFLSEGEVRELLGPAVGENILGLDIDALKARLRASPWVADATVRRTLPDTLAGGDPRARAAGAGRGRRPLPDGRRGRLDRDLRPAHRRLRPADRARPGRHRRRGAPRPRSARRRPARDLGDLAARGLRGAGRGERRPAGGPAGARRGPAAGRPALPEEAPDVPGPARRARRARARGPSTSTSGSGTGSTPSSRTATALAVASSGRAGQGR